MASDLPGRNRKPGELIGGPGDGNTCTPPGKSESDGCAFLLPEDDDIPEEDAEWHETIWHVYVWFPPTCTYVFLQSLEPMTREDALDWVKARDAGEERS